jgi:hypothetical protein
MEKRSLYDTIFYKMECLGEVEKDGHRYKKYKKVLRFPALKPGLALTYALIVGGILASAVLVSLFMANVKPRSGI